MDKPRRPKHLPAVQALAAIGQCKLMSMWDQLFSYLRQPVAQILLTRSDIADRTQYLNAQNTMKELLHMGVIPIVNENDTLSVAEIKFGDNDTLSAITAGMVQADYLFLMTDVDCLYTANPRNNPDAKPIEVVEDISLLTADVSSKGSDLGTGGMGTKIVAARLATSAGVTTVITRSSKPGNIASIVAHAEAEKAAKASMASSLSELPSRSPSSEALAQQISSSSKLQGTTETTITTSTTPSVIDVPLHTRFLPDPSPIRDRYFWLLHGLAPHGKLYIDHGAYNALLSKAGLLPVGVVGVEGNFAQQECVRLFVVDKLSQEAIDAQMSNSQISEHGTVEHRHHSPPSTGRSTPSRPGTPSLQAHKEILPTPFDKNSAVEVGRALVNYSASEIWRIKGLRSTQIAETLGYADNEYVALRENVAIPKSKKV